MITFRKRDHMIILTNSNLQLIQEGDYIYSPTNHTHYQVVMSRQLDLLLRPCLDDGTFGNQLNLLKSSVIGMQLLMASRG